MDKIDQLFAPFVKTLCVLCGKKNNGIQARKTVKGMLVSKKITITTTQ